MGKDKWKIIEALEIFLWSPHVCSQAMRRSREGGTNKNTKAEVRNGLLTEWLIRLLQISINSESFVRV